TLSSGGAVTQSAALTAGGLRLLGSGPFTLTQVTNAVSNLAAAITGSMSFNDGVNLDIGTVGSTVGITTGNPTAGGSVTIVTTGFLTVDQVIDTRSGSGGTLTATGAVINASPVLGAGNVSLSGTNHAPVLSGSNSVTTINEDDVTNSGTLVSALVAGDVTDSDFGALSGIAVTAVDNTHGSWQYTINGGSTWLAFGSPSTASARLLAADANTRVRFVPSANWNGSVASGITFRAWDQSSGANGGTANTTTNGGTTAFSAATASANLTVNSVNDTPHGANKTVTTLEDTPYVFSAGDFGFSDSSDSPANSLLAVEITTLPGAGALTDNGEAVTTVVCRFLVGNKKGAMVFSTRTDIDQQGVP